MFICRHQLLRTYIPLRTSVHHAARRFLVELRPLAAAFADTRSIPRASPAIFTKPFRDDINTSSDSTTLATENFEPHETSSRLSYATSWQEKIPSTQDSLLSSQVTSIPCSRTSPTDGAVSDNILSKIANAVANKQDQNMDKLVIQYIQYLQDNQLNSRVSLLHCVLDIFTASTYDHRPAILHILSELQTVHALNEIPIDTLGTLATSCLRQKLDAAVDAPLYTIFAPIIAHYLSRYHRNKRITVDEPDASRALWILLQMMAKLLQCQQNQLVLSLLRQLISDRIIPASAIEDMGTAGHGFESIVLSILVRCCAHWGWYDRAINLVQSACEWNEHLPLVIADAIIYLFDSLIINHSIHLRAGLQNAAIVIMRFMSLPHLTFPHDALQRFYERAYFERADGIALKVYKFTRTEAVLAKHRYPLPNGNVLTWLLRRCDTRKDVQGVRTIVTEVAEANVELSEPARPLYVQIAASHGMLSPAKKLWENWAAQEDAIILGHCAILVRLVSLCHARIRSRKSYLMELRNANDSGLSAGPSQDPSTSLWPTANHAPDISNDNSTSMVDSTSDDHYLPGPNESDGEDHRTVACQAEIDDYRTFAARVIEGFVLIKSPLSNATHQELNALARAYIICGRVKQGMSTLQIIVDRGEKPDIHDANVALSAVAAKNPISAAQMIEQMVALNLKPDKVSFGTVIHWALQYGHRALVTRLIRRAHELGIPQLSYKTIGKLIRACLDTRLDATPRVRFEDAKNLIESLRDTGLVPSVNMGRDCVVAALRANEPVMAYEFWTRNIRDKVQWSDHEQADVRHLIGRSLQEHYDRGSLEGKELRSMLEALAVSSDSNALYDARRMRKRRQQRRSKAPEN